MHRTHPADAAADWADDGLSPLLEVRPIQATPGSARVFILHPYPVFRFGVLNLLEDEPGLHCVGWAADLDDALRQVRVLNPDIVLADPGAGAQAVASVQSLHRALPLARLLVLGEGPLLPVDSELLHTGLYRRVPRAATATELVQAMLATQLDDEVRGPARAPWTTDCSPDHRPLRARPTLAEPGADLTQRERLLLTLMARGLSNREIAQQLHIAMPTVKFHVTNILSKLQVSNRTSAVLVALRQGLAAIN